MRAGVIYLLGLGAIVFFFLKGDVAGNADAIPHVASSNEDVTYFEDNPRHHLLAHRSKVARLRKRLRAATSADTSHATANLLSVETCKNFLLDAISAEEAKERGEFLGEDPSSSEPARYLSYFMSQIDLCLEDFTPSEQDAIWQIASNHSKREPATVDCHKRDEHLRLEEVQGFKHDVTKLIGKAAMKEKESLCRKAIGKEEKEYLEQEFNSCTVANYACAAELSPTQANDLLELLREHALSRDLKIVFSPKTIIQTFWQTLSTEQQQKLSRASRSSRSGSRVDLDLMHLVDIVEPPEGLEDVLTVEDN